jgi:predicted amidohydrolase YtcJ
MTPFPLAAPALLAASLCAGLGAQQHADMILFGGRIATLAHGEGLVQALAVANGLIHATGTDEDIQRFRGPDTRIVDLGGRTVVPGLCDSHLHVVRGGRFYNLELRWDGVPSLGKALSMVREQAARTPQGQWVRVIGGWTPFQFEERRMPTVAELNEAAPDTPVFVLFLYSKGFLNRAGVESLGITAETKPPRGGHYVLVDGGAELIADPEPAILYQTVAALPHLSAADQENSTLQFCRELNRFGLTSAIDPGGGGHLFPDDYGSAKKLGDEGRLPLRIACYLFPQRPGRELDDFRTWTAGDEPDRSAAVAHAGSYVLTGGGELLVYPASDYENFMAARPLLAQSMDRQLEAVVAHLVDSGWAFRIHATYAESIDRMLDVFERVDERHPLRSVRWAIDHAETIRGDQIQRIQRLGGGIAIQDRMAFAGEYFVERYGAERAASAPPLRRLLESGVPLGCGTDGTRVSSYNPWLSLQWLVTGRTVGGTQLYPPENRLSRSEALRLYTSGSAWFSGDEQRRGTLRPGQCADFAVLSADYFSVPEGRIGGIESVLTVVGGAPVFGAGPFAGLVPPAPPVSPAWSPVAAFGGYHAAAAGDR